MNEFEEQQSLEIDNRSKLLGDVLKDVIIPGSKLQIAAATFSMFAYKDLKKELETIDELKFIFTNPTFTNNEFEKEFREYSIPKKSTGRFHFWSKI